MNLEELRAHFMRLGVTRAYYKWLASNDNSKNQIYLGSDYLAINVLPVGAVHPERSGEEGQVLKAPLPLDWLTNSGELSPAPNAQIILYGQYPEIRLSGFLLGSKQAPGSILRTRDGGRVLFLGVTAKGRVVGYAAARNDPIVGELPPRPPADRIILNELSLFGVAQVDESRVRLLRELARIHRAGWLDAKRLDRHGIVVPCQGENCGGYTLEAELGVRPNGFSKPDFEGWEVKQHTVRVFGQASGPITLITPEPDGGYYKTRGAAAFVRLHGYSDARIEDRINFSGRHLAGIRVARTKLTLEVQGFDPSTGKITDVDGGICLISDTGEIAAKWTYAKLIGQWKLKHSKAVFVSSLHRKEPARQYWFGPTVDLGQDTDLALFLGAVCRGLVYYDPGTHLIEASTQRARAKQRSQFRMHRKQLAGLYRKFNEERLA